MMVAHDSGKDLTSTSCSGFLHTSLVSDNKHCLFWKKRNVAVSSTKLLFLEQRMLVTKLPLGPDLERCDPRKQGRHLTTIHHRPAGAETYSLAFLSALPNLCFLKSNTQLYLACPISVLQQIQTLPLTKTKPDPAV